MWCLFFVVLHREGENDGIRDGIVGKGKASTLPTKSHSNHHSGGHSSEQKHKDKSQQKRDKEMKVCLMYLHVY